VLRSRKSDSIALLALKRESLCCVARVFYLQQHFLGLRTESAGQSSARGKMKIGQLTNAKKEI
jgi:hypothetical protein